MSDWSAVNKRCNLVSEPQNLELGRYLCVQISGRLRATLLSSGECR